MRIDPKKYFAHSDGHTLMSQIVEAINDHEKMLKTAVVQPSFQVLEPMDREVWQAIRKFMHAVEMEQAATLKVIETLKAEIKALKAEKS